GLPSSTTIGEKTIRISRGMGGNVRSGLRMVHVVNVYDPETKQYFKATIAGVVENPADPNYVRRNILTKGAIIKTEKGNARIVSRPGQSTTLNAVLVK
ncbi:MAG: 30S ribosomal protein S8e, partial [Nanoarchaeota archaeon]